MTKYRIVDSRSAERQKLFDCLFHARPSMRGEDAVVGLLAVCDDDEETI